MRAWTRRGSGADEWWSHGDWTAKKVGNNWILRRRGEIVCRHEFLCVVMEYAETVA